MSEILHRHKETWENKKILRIVYSQWYQKIIRDLSPIDGPTVELGAGSGNFKEFKPDVISSDIDPCPWLDMVFDAHQMPFTDTSVANIVMIDVLHHLDNPVVFLREAARVLKPGGRLIILEPYPSLFSLPIYRNVHPEPFIFTDKIWEKQEINEKHPWDSNQATAYLLFFKYQKTFREIFGQKFSLKIRKRLSFLLYPASGGFENKQLAPDFLIPILQVAEWLLRPLARWLAFRCYVVIEKK
jgi:SAM-dependent methyltransferase